MPTISFISANYVARASEYPGGGVGEWGRFDQATINAASASPQHFMGVARDVAGAGFEAIDIWTAHCHWQHHYREDYLEQVKGICSQFDLSITSYVGGLNVKDAAGAERVLRFMKQLGAPVFAGGMWGADPVEMTPWVNDTCQRLDVKWAFENHPEKTVDEILAKIGGGRYASVGVALDTGWCGTQGMDAAEAIRRLGDKLLVVHLKDIVAAGAHDTCALGDGIVGIEKVVRTLKEVGYDGTIGIEHEPFDRDPMPEVQTSLKRLQDWLR